MNIKNIAIVGGTHGNEYTGVYLIKKATDKSISREVEWTKCRSANWKSKSI